MALKLYRFSTPERSCAWVPDPKAGFQFLGNKNSWWIWYGETWLCQVVRCTKEAGGGWMLWYPYTKRGYKGERCPKFPTLIRAARAALRLTGHKPDKPGRRKPGKSKKNADNRTKTGQTAA